MKIWVFSLALVLVAGSSQGALVYNSVTAFEAVVGKPDSTIDFASEVLPYCANVAYYESTGEVISAPGGNTCVASSTLAGGVRTYNMRGEAWIPGIVIGSGDQSGMAPGGFVYQGHLWNGPTTFLGADPLGGTSLRIEQYRPFITLGIHTTLGFFGWLPSAAQDLTDDGLLVLPAGAEITRLDYDYGPNVVPEPASGLLVALGLLTVVASRRISGRPTPSYFSRQT